jgi:hypothetical protein
MIQFTERIKYSVIIYLAISVFIWMQKPKLMFNNNNIKSFGIGVNKTIFYYPLVMIVLAIVIYSISLNLFNDTILRIY